MPDTSRNESIAEWMARRGDEIIDRLENGEISEIEWELVTYAVAHRLLPAARCDRFLELLTGKSCAELLNETILRFNGQN